MDSKQTSDNPLSEPQRESAGAQSYDRFEYQYHWALCKAFSSYKESNDFAIFMEYHEDVVFASSIDIDKVKFTFNQIKANANKTYTAKVLTKRENGIKPSLLGKLCSSVSDKKYFEKVEKLDFITTSGFNLTKNSKLNLNSYKLSSLSCDEASEIIKCLSAELPNFENFPQDIIHFTTSDIPLESYYEHTISRITDSVEEVYPQHLLRAKDIYRVLMDSLRIRGKNVFDYENWSDALNNKALTYKDIDTVVTKRVSKGNSNLNLEAIKYIFEDLDIKGIIKAKILKKISLYSLSLLSPTFAMLKAQREIQELIDKNSKNIDHQMSYELLERMIIDLSKDTIGLFEDNISISAAIIYEMVEETS